MQLLDLVTLEYAAVQIGDLPQELPRLRRSIRGPFGEPFEEEQAEELKREKDLQSLIEANLETVLGVKFIATEFPTTHGGIIDTLGLDENGAPVVIEYKKRENQNIINQGIKERGLQHGEFIQNADQPNKENRGKNIKPCIMRSLIFIGIKARNANGG